MTAEQRSSVQNAIWLCSNDAARVDRDITSYPADELRRLKVKHEIAMAREQGVPNTDPYIAPEILAIGPDIVATGELLEVGSDSWTITIRHFVMGELEDLYSLIEDFENVRMENRYVILNSKGDGRTLAGPPYTRTVSRGHQLTLSLGPRAHRIRAQDLPKDLALKDGDIFSDGRDIATVFGLDALPQKLRTNLSLIKETREIKLDDRHGRLAASMVRNSQIMHPPESIQAGHRPAREVIPGADVPRRPILTAVRLKLDIGARRGDASKRKFVGAITKALHPTLAASLTNNNGLGILPTYRDNTTVPSNMGVWS